MSDFWRKADGAARSARLLLDAGELDGAVNRAYYAMFDAARAALGGIDPNLAAAKTHATILRNFSTNFVRDRGFDVELGRALQRAFQLRVRADYESEDTSEEAARSIVQDMERFVSTLAEFVEKSGS